MKDLIIDTMTNKVSKISFNKIVIKENTKEIYIIYDVIPLENNESTTILQFVNNETLTEAMKNYGYEWLNIWQ